MKRFSIYSLFAQTSLFIGLFSPTFAHADVVYMEEAGTEVVTGAGINLAIKFGDFKKEQGFGQIGQSYFRLGVYSSPVNQLNFSILQDNLPNGVNDISQLESHCKRSYAAQANNALVSATFPWLKDTNGFMFHFAHAGNTPEVGDIWQQEIYFSTIIRGYWFELHFSKTFSSKPTEQDLDALWAPIKRIVMSMKEAKLSIVKIPSAHETFDINAYGTLAIDVAKGWFLESQFSADGPSVGAEFSSEQGLLKLIVIKAQEAQDESRLKQRLEALGNKMLAGAVEKEITISDLKGPAVKGYHFILTDKKWVGEIPPTGEWPIMAQGVFISGEMAGFYTVFFRDKSDFNQATSMLQSIEITKND